MTTVITKTTFIERGIRTRSISPNLNVKQKLNQFLSYLFKYRIAKNNVLSASWTTSFPRQSVFAIRTGLA